MDLGCVSAALPIALELLPGEFIRADGQKGFPQAALD